MKRTIISSILILLLATGMAWGKGPWFSGGGGASTSAEVVAVFGSGSCSGYLKSDGTCDTPSGTLSGGAQYYLPVWTAANTLGKLAAAGTAGNPLISGGAAANPSWLSIVLAGGTNTFSITNGTASLDVAAGATLNIDKSLQVATGAVVINGNAGGSSVLTLPNQTTVIGTLTDGKWCSYASSGTTLSCTQDAPAGSGDVTDVGDCAGGACYDGSSDGGTYIRLYDGNSHYTQYQAGDSTGNLTFITPNSALARGSLMVGSSTANTFGWLTVGTSGKIITTDGTDPSWSAYTVAAPGAAGAVLYSDGTNWTRAATLSITLDNAAAQFADSSASTKKMKIDPVGMTAGKTLTLKGSFDQSTTIDFVNTALSADDKTLTFAVPITDNATYTFPAATATLVAEGVATGGILLGDASPDADGEIGYASNAYLWYANSEDWKITASSNLWTFDSNTSAAFAFTPGVTFNGAITANGAVTLGDGGDDVRIKLQKNTSDGTWNGITLNLTCHETIAFGQLIFINSDGEAALADADAAATMPAVAIAVVGGSASDTCTFLTHGVISETDWNWTAGQTLYVSETAGGIENTVGNISDANDVVQVIGVALGADTILFNPSLTTVVVK